MKYDKQDRYEYSGAEETRQGKARLSRRERRKKRRLEEQLDRLRQKEGSGGRARAERNEAGGRAGGRPADEGAGLSDNGRQGVEEEPRRRSRVGATVSALLSGNILSRSEVSRTYPFLLFVAFLAFLYIGNIFSMQKLHRENAALTREVRELRTKSMTFASARMQATRQSNIINEIRRRELPLRESLTPNKVIPK
jgi:hypothetical protein